MARSFNGSSDYINLGATAAALVNRQEGSVFLRVVADGSTSIEEIFDFRVNGDNEIEITDFHGVSGLGVRFVYISGANYSNSINASSLPPGAHTIGFTWSSSGNVTAAYIDGVSVGTDTAAGTFSTATVNNYYLGADAGPGSFWSGEQSEFAIWTAPLTAEEMVALCAGFPPKLMRPQSLIDYYPFYGASSPEYGINGNTATVVGTTRAPHPRVMRRKWAWTRDAGVGGSSGATGLATETDTALNLGAARPAGLAGETNSALALSGIQLRATGLATETDTALNLGSARPAGLAIESDSAFALSGTQLRATGLATETDTALNLGSARPVGLAVETNSALALSGLYIRATGLSSEADTAFSLSVNFESLSNSGFMGANADYTFSRTVSGTDRYLVTDVAVLSAGSNVVSVTDDSGGANAAMTLIASRATGAGSGLIESWGLVNPAPGTKNIRVVLSAAVSTAASAVNYTGVHQTTPTEAANSATATNAGIANDATLNITPVATGAWVHAALATNDNSVSSADRRDSISDVVGGSIEIMDTRGQVPPATAREMRVTALGVTAAWTMVGFAIRPVSAVGNSAPVGLAAETDSAFNLGSARPAGISAETDTALNLGSARPAGLAIESNSAFALSGTQLRATGLATETDTALALSAPGEIFGTETDTAFALAGVQIRAVGLAAETDAALPLAGAQVRVVGAASESDTAFALAAIQRLVTGIALETDTAIARPAGSTGGSANPADVWNYVMANGETAETNLLALLECCQKMMKIQTNKRVTDPVAGTETLFDNDSLTVLLQGALFEDAAGVQRYRGQGAERRDRMV